MRSGTRIAACTAALALLTGVAHAQVSREGATVAFDSKSKGGVDYANAKPFKLPKSSVAPGTPASASADAASVKFPGPPGSSDGAEGNGKTSPKKLPVSKFLPDEDGGVSPQQYGTGNHPFTTSVAQFYTGSYYRRSGKLFFRDGSSSYVCSASLIKRGLVVTAAHCVSKFGQSRFYTNIQFVPAYNKGSAPFGVWNSAQARVMTSYFNGTDTCSANGPGVVCQNDVAVIVLQAQSGAYPGTQTGWYGYGYNGYSYVSNLVNITQIGYPVALNGGLEQIRTDSYGFVSSSNANNTIIGSLQTGGSSGGPWLVNFGLSPTLSSGISYGSAPAANTVVGATSWGYTNQAVKQQGASPFTSSNIVALVNAACGAFPAACN